MHRVQFIFCWLFICCMAAHAQCVLKGKVLDGNRVGIPFATVQLFSQDSVFVKGGTTDSIGNFFFERMSKGDYSLRISSLGYQAIYIPVQLVHAEQELAPVVLQEESVLLDGVEVKASSYIRQKDRVLIIPDKQQVRHAGTGYDLLYNLMIPGITVDRRKGTVSSTIGEATLYINGRKAEFREIQSLRPRDIEKVEYFDMPTGKYAGDKLSINYVVKERKSGGYVSLDATQNIGYLQGDYNVAAKIAHNDMQYTVWGGHTMGKHGGIYEEKDEMFRFPEYWVNRQTQTEEARVSKNRQYIQLNVEKKKEKYTLNGKLGLVRNESPYERSRKGMIYTGKYDNTSEVANSISQKNLMPTLDLYGSFQLAPNQILETNLKTSYTHNSYDRHYGEDSYNSFTDVKEDFYTIDFNGNYNIQLKHNNSAGINLAHLRQISSSDYSGDYSSWNHLWTSETLLMGQYNQTFCNKFTLSLQAGIDWLEYRVHGNKYHSFLSPHVNLMFNYRMPKNQNLMFALNTGNSNPPSNIVSDVDQNIDLLQVQRGNPWLDKANYYVSYLVYSWQKGKFNIQALGYYFGAVPTTALDYYVEGDKLVNSYRSDGDYHNVEASLSMGYKLADNLRMSVKGRYDYYKTTGKISADYSAWTASIDINYFLKDWSVNVYGKSTSRSLSMYPSYVRTPASYGGSVSWHHGNWMAEAGTENPFSSHLRNVEFIDADVYRFHTSKYSATYQQTGYIKVAYTFDFGKKTSRDSKNINTTINSAILKAE